LFRCFSLYFLTLPFVLSSPDFGVVLLVGLPGDLLVAFLVAVPEVVNRSYTPVVLVLVVELGVFVGVSVDVLGVRLEVDVLVEVDVLGVAVVVLGVVDVVFEVVDVDFDGVREVRFFTSVVVFVPLRVVVVVVVVLFKVPVLRGVAPLGVLGVVTLVVGVFGDPYNLE